MTTHKALHPRDDNDRISAKKKKQTTKRTGQHCMNTPIRGLEYNIKKVKKDELEGPVTPLTTQRQTEQQLKQGN